LQKNAFFTRKYTFKALKMKCGKCVLYKSLRTHTHTHTHTMQTFKKGAELLINLCSAKGQPMLDVRKNVKFK
jgi:hypothetical protein